LFQIHEDQRNLFRGGRDLDGDSPAKVALAAVGGPGCTHVDHPGQGNGDGSQLAGLVQSHTDDDVAQAAPASRNQLLQVNPLR